MWGNLISAVPEVSRTDTRFSALRLNAGAIDSFFVEDSLLAFMERSLGRLQGTVLDVGCGDKKYKPIILQGKKVKKYLGLDLQRGKYGIFYAPDVEWDGKTMPLGDGSADSAIVIEVLEHCEHPDMVLAEVGRVLKPGGTLLVTVPFIHPLHGLPSDFCRFSPQGLEVLLSAAGFGDIEMAMSGSYDATLGHVLGLWVKLRPMPALLRKILRKLAVVPIGFLYTLDKRQSKLPKENSMGPSVFACARRLQ